MAHFARLDDNNNVENVIVVANHNTNDENGVEREEIGVAFCKKLFGENSKWKKCSYSGRIRKNYPSIGWFYHEGLDIFLPPKPYDSWRIDESLGEWVAPIPPPAREEHDPESPTAPRQPIWSEERQEWYYIR
tara:strand:+ start:331 stop:726 length:396 start_codon:yes stop_codon:yes gene_type:complete